jgi:hypothetical protein
MDSARPVCCRARMKHFQGVVLGLAAVLAGCAVAPSSSESTEALYGPCIPISPPPSCAAYDPAYCDPAYNADLGPIEYTCQQYVPCADGILMYAYATPDCRFCIPYNVCDNHGGPSFPIE